jgi:hypothetical protein
LQNIGSLCEEGLTISECHARRGLMGESCDLLCLRQGENFDPQTQACVAAPWACVADEMTRTQTCTRQF